jgi:hypothetical protein
MKARTHCPKCGHNYRIDDRLLGRKAKCKACGVSFSLVANGDAPGLQVLSKTCADKHTARPATVASSDQSLPMQNITEPNPISEKFIYIVVGTAIMLFILGNCFAYHHYWSQNKIAKKTIKDMGGYDFSSPSSQRPSVNTGSESMGIISQYNEELKNIGFLAWNSNGFIRVFSATLDGSLSITVFILAVTAFVSLLLIIVSLIAILRRYGNRPTFYFKFFAIGLGITLIVLSGLKYRSIIYRINQDKKSVAVNSAWIFLKMESDDNKRLPTSIDDISEQVRYLFDKLYYAGFKVSDIVKKTQAEWMLLAPRDCHDSDYLYLAVVMQLINDNYTPCVRIMSGSKIIDMINKVE